MCACVTASGGPARGGMGGDEEDIRGPDKDKWEPSLFPGAEGQGL